MTVDRIDRAASWADEFAGRQEQEAEPGGLPAGWRTMAEALEDPEATSPAPVVARGVAWAARVTLFASREGMGKSTLAGAIAAAVTQGREWLGAPTVAGPVVILDLEEADPDLLRRLQVHRADPERVVYACSTAQPLTDLEDVCRAVRPVLVVVDSLATLAGAEGITEAGSSAQWVPLLTRLSAIARETGAAVVLVAHSKKDASDYRDSTAIGAAVDVVALLHGPGEGEVGTVRHIRYRKARLPVEELVVEFAGDGYSLASEATAQDRVLAYIAGHPGCSLRALRAGVPGRAVDVDAALAALLALGRVVDSGGSGGRSLTVTPGHGAGHGTESKRDTTGTRSGHTPGHAPVSAPYMGERDTVREAPDKEPDEVVF